MTLGVRLSAEPLVLDDALILVGLIPFAGLGIMMGHLLTTDSIGPAMGGTTALLALLGGVWFPITGGSAMHAIAEALPSYWLVQASHVGLGGQGWGTKGWAVVAAWSALAAFAAAGRTSATRAGYCPHRRPKPEPEPKNGARHALFALRTHVHCGARHRQLPTRTGRTAKGAGLRGLRTGVFSQGGTLGIRYRVVVAVKDGVQLLTSSAPSLEEVAAAAGAADMFLFRRIDPGRFAHIGGVGRGVGWAGIVEVGVADEPFVAESLQTRHRRAPLRRRAVARVRAVLRDGSGDRAGRRRPLRGVRLGRRDASCG